MLKTATGALLALTVSVLAATAASANTTNRYDCDEMRGTPYQHPAERPWYWENCVWDIYGGGVSTAPAPVSHYTVPAPKPGVSVQEQFVAGFYAGGGWDVALALCIVARESEWDVYAVNYAGPYHGLAQFLPSTWESVGGGDWFDPWTQGRNFARNAAQSGYATQWPAAYRLCS